jgi:imidazolonepropionase
MNETLAVIHCSPLLTLAGPARPRVGPEMRDLGLIDDGALIIEAGRVIGAGSTDDVRAFLPSHCEIVDANHRLVAPGFVDAHTHPVFAGNRADEFEMRALGKSYQEIAEAGGGIKSTVRKTRAATEEELVKAGERYAQWFLRCGTTTLEAKSGYGLTTEDELKMLRAIKRLRERTPLDYAPTFLGAHTLPSEYAGRSEEYVDLVVNEILPRLAGEKLAEFCDVFCEKGAFDVESSRRILLAAKSHGLGLRVHADQLSRNGGSLLAGELGARTADHLEYAGPEEIAALKNSSVQPVLLPASVLMLGSTRYPDARAMIDAGLAVVLATDFNPGSSPTPSMLLVLSLAAAQMKLSIAESITAATINAAYSLNRGDEIGSLEVGKRADFVMYDCDDYRELAYFAGIEHPTNVFIRGQRVWVKSN